MRTLAITRNVTAKAFTAGVKPNIYYHEKIVLNLTVVDGDADTPINLTSAAASWTASIDCDYNNTTAILIKTESAGINVAGDWDGGNADLTKGQLSIKFDAYTVPVLARLGRSAKLPSKLEVLGFDADGFVTATYVMAFDVLNIQDQGESVPELIDGKIQLGGNSYVWLNPANGHVEIINNGVVLAFFE